MKNLTIDSRITNPTTLYLHMLVQEKARYSIGSEFYFSKIGFDSNLSLVCFTHGVASYITP